MAAMASSHDRFDDDRPVPVWDTEAGNRPGWTDPGGEVLVDNPWLQVTRHAATAPTGAAADYVVARPKTLATGVLPLHDDGTVTLVGQSRFALMNHSWEMPEGGAPFDENPLAGVQRELAEEAGLKARYWTEVLRMELSNSITDERAIAWLAWGLSPVPQAPDPTEVIETVRVPFLTLMTEIDRGAIRDAFTIATALKAYQLAVQHRLPGWLAHAMLTRV